MEMPKKITKKVKKPKRRNPYALPAKQRKAGFHKSKKRRIKETELDKEIKDNG